MTKAIPRSPHERLQAAMAWKGIESASELSRRTGIPEGTCRTHVNGTRGIPDDVAKTYARHTGVDAAYITYGTGKGPGGKSHDSADATPTPTSYNLPEWIPATEQMHIAELIDGLAKRVPEVVAFVHADMEACATAKLRKVQPFPAFERGGMISANAKRAEIAGRKAQAGKNNTQVKPLSRKA